MTDYNNLVAGVAVFVFMIFILILILVVEKMQRLLDRYRLKYSFDREIEMKEISGKEEDKPERLNKRERLFKRRVFKD